MLEKSPAGRFRRRSNATPAKAPAATDSAFPDPLLRRRTLLQSMLGFCALPLLGCSPDTSSDGKPALAPTHLHIGIDLWPGYFPILLVQELGYLQGTGVSLEVSLPENTQMLLSGILAGQFDGVCVSLGDIIALTQTTSDVCMVLASDESSGGDAVFANQAITSAAQIRGRRLATNLGGFGELLMRKFLARYEVEPSAVTWVQADASEIKGLMESDRIDIGHTWEPYASEMRAAGFQQVFSSADTPGLIPDGLMVRSTLLANHRAALAAVIAAWLRAADWWLQHREQGDQLILKRLAGRQDAATLVQSMRGLRLLDAAENRRRFKQRQAEDGFYPVAQQYVELFVSKGSLTQRPNLDKLLDGSLIP